MSARYASSYCVLNELKKGLEYMASIIAASMVCFPYVIAGLGQAIIVGTHSAGRTVRDTAEEIKGQKIPFMTSNEIADALGWDKNDTTSLLSKLHDDKAVQRKGRPKSYRYFVS